MTAALDPPAKRGDGGVGCVREDGGTATAPRLKAMGGMTDFETLVREAEAEFAHATVPAELENAKARFLGKSGRITEQLKSLGTLGTDERKRRGAEINAAKERIESALAARRSALAQA